MTRKSREEDVTLKIKTILTSLTALMLKMQRKMMKKKKMMMTSLMILMI
jgi:hypothetical protein